MPVVNKKQFKYKEWSTIRKGFLFFFLSEFYQSVKINNENLELTFVLKRQRSVHSLSFLY